MSEGWHVLVRGGVILPIDPGPASAFLRAINPGAYTTTRTFDGGLKMLYWDRHLARLNESVSILLSSYPHLYPSMSWNLDINRLIQPSVRVGLVRALELRRAQEEISFTVLLSSDNGVKSNQAEGGCEVYVHASSYNAVGEGKMPRATCVAVLGPGRTLALAKYSLWARTRERLEKLRPANTNEIILSNDGDLLLEGTLTNFFVVARTCQNALSDKKDLKFISGKSVASDWSDVEVQTAPLKGGVLPGIMRNLVIEVCKEAAIPFREVAPSWASRHTWKEAFVTSSIRILQPVVKIQRPCKWLHDFTLEDLKESSWQHVDLEASGILTQKIHKLVMNRATQDSFTIREVMDGR